MLKQDLILQIMNQTDHPLPKGKEKVIGFVKNELCGKVMTELKM